MWVRMMPQVVHVPEKRDTVVSQDRGCGRGSDGFLDRSLLRITDAQACSLQLQPPGPA
jgi:hypothetical protein